MTLNHAAIAINDLRLNRGCAMTELVSIVQATMIRFTEKLSPVFCRSVGALP
jgi:hypothetical protein